MKYLILMLLLFACTKPEAEVEEEVAPRPIRVRSVEYIEAEFSQINHTVLSNVTLQPRAEVSLTAKSGGVIVRAAGAFGEKVSAGSPLLTLENGVQEATLKSARTSHEQAKLQYSSATSLFERGSISRAEYLASKSALHSAEMNLAIQEELYRNRFHRSPIGGHITFWDDNARAGLYINPGTPFATIVDIRQLKALVPISASDVGFVNVGNGATIRINGIDRVLDGSVVAVSASAGRGTGAFIAEVRVDNRDEAIRAGMTASVRLKTDLLRDGIALPAEAVVRRLGVSGVFVIRDDKAHFHRVESINVLGDMELVIDGISEGDAVVVTGASQLQDGDPVAASKRAEVL